MVQPLPDAGVQQTRVLLAKMFALSVLVWVSQEIRLFLPKPLGFFPYFVHFLILLVALSFE